VSSDGPEPSLSPTLPHSRHSKEYNDLNQQGMADSPPTMVVVVVVVGGGEEVVVVVMTTIHHTFHWQ